MNKKSIIILAISISIVSLISIYAVVEKPHIAYVRSQELVYKYQGMREAQAKYQQKVSAWQANVDTLKSDFKRASQSYESSKQNLTTNEKSSQIKLLQMQEKNLIQYSNAIQQKAKEEDDKITTAVLNQINSFVADYGKEHGFDVILGTTVSGNVLYGKASLDITDDVLKALNNHYLDKKADL